MGFISSADKKQRLIKYISLCSAILLCFATLLIYFLSFADNIGGPEDYAFQKSFESYSPYAQQLDAFLKGQLHFDYEPSQALRELENPYDPAQRAGVSYLYDRAYFEGAYYSYFGTAPIFTVMLPCYLLTGWFPGDGAMQLIFMMIFALFMCLLVFMLAQRVAPRVHPAMWGLVAYGGVISSLQMMFGRGRTPFYYVAATSAMAFLAVFAYLFFRGIFAEKRSCRLILFTLSGLFFALCFHSRVNTAFAAAFFVIPCIIFGILLKRRAVVYEAAESDGKFTAFCKKHSVGAIAAELGALSSFVVIGFILAFIYNYARFGNIFDFGSAYQLTVGDVSKYKLDVNELGYSVYHYFLAPIKDTADGLNLNYGKISQINRYLYVDGHFGILQIPMLWTAFVTPFTLTSKKRSTLLRFGTLCALVGCFVIAWVDFCLGGVIYRYLCDFSAVFAVIASIGLMLIADKLCDIERAWLRHALLCLLALFVIFSVYRTFNIMAIENGNLLAMSEDSLFFKLFRTSKGG